MLRKMIIQPLRQVKNRHIIILILIIFVAVSLRVGFSIYLGDGLEGSQQRRAYDQFSYNYLAQSILKGQGFSFEQNWYPFTPAHTPTAHWSFLYPLYLAGVYFLGGIHPLLARIVQAVLIGILSTYLLYRLGERLEGKITGLVSAGLGSVYAYFIFYDSTLMTEAFFTLGVLCSFNLAIDIVSPKQDRLKSIKPETPPYSLWVLLGLAIGFTGLLRQTFLVWLPILFVWMVWAGRTRFQWWKIIIPLGVTLLLVLPWTIRNYMVYRNFLPLNSNAGYALYSSNHPNQGTNFDQDYVAPLPEDLISKGLNEAQWNTALTIRGVQFIIQDPSRYLLLSLSRIPIFFNFWFSPESDRASNLMRVLSYGLYLPFFLYGIFLSLRDWRKFSLLYLFAFIFSSMHIFTWASIRYRLPIDAVFMPFAAMAIIDLSSKIRARLHFRPRNGNKREASGISS